jgi:hypothetical protein
VNSDLDEYGGIMMVTEFKALSRKNHKGTKKN